MSFNFDALIDRRSPGCVKWSHYPEDVLPMWVADMDFAVAEPITRALQARVAHGVFGYEMPTAALREAIVGWLARRHGWHIHADHIVFLPGLVSGLNAVCRAVGRLGDRAACLSPIYPPFLSAPVNQGMAIDVVPMAVSSDAGGRLRYEIDFDALERAITPRTTLLLHCHPHNPIGHEFSRDDNRRLAELCLRHGLTLCSDEIHGDLTLDGAPHTPVAALAPEIAGVTITLMAPSKTFNVPGLGCSMAIIPNAELRKRVNKASSGIVPHVNVLGYIAAIAAYTEGETWLAKLQSYLTGNRDYLVNYFDTHLPQFKVTAPEATYLAWIDCRESGIEGNAQKFFLDQAKVAFNEGANFGKEGEGFIRLNFGCPRGLLVEGLERMQGALVHHAV